VGKAEAEVVQCSEKSQMENVKWRISNGKYGKYQMVL
jgi:hypothetical protein